MTETTQSRWEGGVFHGAGGGGGGPPSSAAVPLCLVPGPGHLGRTRLLAAWEAARRQELPFGEHLTRGSVNVCQAVGVGGSWHRCPSGVPRLLGRGCSLQGAFVS